MEKRGLDNTSYSLYNLIKNRDSVILVHAIRKKTDRIPSKDLEVCIKRKYIAEEYATIERIDL